MRDSYRRKAGVVLEVGRIHLFANRGNVVQAVIIKRYGPPEVLEMADLSLPRAGRKEVRIRVRAAAINPIDWKLRSGALRWVYPQRLPLVLGFDVAGEVDQVGADVGDFVVGERVYARLDTRGGGGYAEYAVTTSASLAAIPAQLSDTDAAAIPLAGLTALQSLRDLGKITHGSRVLINGASGGVGVFAVQIARALGAHVTAVCSATNHELVTGLGAQRVIDYCAQDFTQAAERYDMVFDVVANKTFAKCRKVLTPRGVYVATLPTPALLVASAMTRLSRSQRAHFIMVKSRGSDLHFLSGLVERGQLRAVIDSEFPLAQAVDAHRRSETERARGKIVLRVS